LIFTFVYEFRKTVNAMISHVSGIPENVEVREFGGVQDYLFESDPI
jgi:hypothetical protein